MTRVIPDDIVKAGYCITGARRHFPQVGFARADFKRLIQEGIPVEEFEGVDDLMVQNVIAAAKRREAAHG